MLTFLLRSIVHSAKFGRMHAAVTIMAADNHFHISPGRHEDFWQIIIAIDVLLFLRRGARDGAPSAYATVQYNRD